MLKTTTSPLKSSAESAKCFRQMATPPPPFDMGLQRLELVRNIVDGVPNPFILGTEGYRYYEQQFYDKVTAARLRS